MVLSDYGKGVLSAELAAAVIAAARQAKVPVIVDPKGTDWSRYRGATLATPNRRELAEASRMPADGEPSHRRRGASADGERAARRRCW